MVVLDHFIKNILKTPVEQFYTGKTPIQIENESQARVDREQGIVREGSTN